MNKTGKDYIRQMLLSKATYITMEGYICWFMHFWESNDLGIASTMLYCLSNRN